MRTQAVTAGSIVVAVASIAVAFAAPPARPGLDLGSARAVDLTWPLDDKTLHFPSFGSEAVALLVHARHIAAIGVDTASIDHGPSKDFPVHRLVGAAGVPGFENVAHLDEVPETGAWVVALPMKIAGGSGGPLRIVALVPSR